MIITGIFMIAVGIYLILSYAIKAQARFTMPNSGPAIYMMIGCGILPVVVGVFGIILGFQKNPISSTILFIFEISLVLVIILLIATAGYFIGTYTKTSEVQIRAYLRVNKAWVKQIMVLRTCFLNNTVCDVDTCASDKEEVDEDSESEQYRTLLAWLVQCFSSRVKADFFLCGFAGLLVGIYAFLMGGSFAIELLIGFCRNLGKPEVEEQEYSVEEDDESVRPSSEIEMEEVEEKEKEKETEDNMKH